MRQSYVRETCVVRGFVLLEPENLRCGETRQNVVAHQFDRRRTAA